MPKGTRAAHDVACLILMGKRPDWLSLETFWLALHTSDPTKADQTAGEIDYSGYRRVELDRFAWKSDGENLSNADIIDFPVNAGRMTKPFGFLSIGTKQTGDGQVIYVARFKPITLKPNQRLRFEPGELIVTET